MADIAYRSQNIATSAASSSLSVTAPAGTTAGDLVIVLASMNAPDASFTTTDNNGSTPFTKDRNDFETFNGLTLSIFSRRIQAGDPTSYAFTNNAGSRFSLIALTFQNPDPTTIYDVVPSGSTVIDKGADAATVNCTSVTSTRNGCIHLMCATREGGSGVFDNTPTGYTWLVSGGSLHAQNSLWLKVLSTAGASGTQTVTASGGGSGSALTQSFILLNGVTAVLTVSVSDSSSVTESAAFALAGDAFPVSVNDAVTATEAVFLSSAVLLAVSVNEAITVTESSITQINQFVVAVADASTVTEFLSFAYAQNTLAPSVSDPVVMGDVISLASFQGVAILAMEAVGVNRGFALLSWNPSAEPDVIGYKVYQGTTTLVYDTVYDVGNVISYTVQNLNFGTTYYFAITAYDASFNESGFSPEVSKTPTDVLLGDLTISMNIFTVTDATTVTESATIFPHVDVSVGETPIIVTELLTVRFPFKATSVSDAVTLSEAAPLLTLTTQAQIFMTVSDATTVTESNTQTLRVLFILTVTEATTVTESRTVAILMQIRAMAAGQDTTTISELRTVQIIVGGGTTLTFADTVLVTDATTVQMSKVLLSVFETVVIGDGFNIPPNIGGRILGHLTSPAGTSGEAVIT